MAGGQTLPDRDSSCTTLDTPVQAGISGQFDFPGPPVVAWWMTAAVALFLLAAYGLRAEQPRVPDGPSPQDDQ